MAQVTRKLPWHRRLSLRWALVFTTLLCALAGFLLLALETAVLEEARDAIYYKYITPYYAEESATGDLYVISPDGKTVYVEATMPYAYVDPDTGETYPLADTPSSWFVPAGPLRFFYQHVGEIALGVYVATAVLCFLADAWWFYHWKIKKPLAVLGAASLLRPARARVRLEDDDTLLCCEGYGPARRIPMGDIARVDLLGGRRMAIFLKNGRRVNLEFLFEGREIFLAELRSRGIPVETPAQR